MPERKRRRAKVARARRYLAASDGEIIRIKACCRLVVTLGPVRIRVAHDDHCAALRPTSPLFMAARLQADQAVAEMLTRRGLPTLAVIVT